MLHTLSRLQHTLCRRTTLTYQPLTSRAATRTAASFVPPPAFTPSDDDPYTRVTTIANGDQVSYTDIGPASAPPLIFLHGSPSCRLETKALLSLLQEVPIRLITPDRPGVGYTTFRPDATLLDYPQQISQLASQIGLNNGYCLMGGSGGGPYALACAKVLSKSECKAVGVLAGVAPLDTGEGLQGMRWGSRTLLTATSKYPRLTSWLADRFVARYARDRDPKAVERSFQGQMKYFWALADMGLMKLTDEERKIFKEQEAAIVKEIADIAREHFRQGTQGFIKEGQILSGPWGFKIEDIERDGIRYFYGADDINTPIGPGRAMAARSKRAIFKEYAGMTHLTIAEKHGREILEEMINAE